MRILFWAESFHPEIGGAQVASADLAEALHQQGHQLLIVSHQFEGREERETFRAIPVRRLPLRVPLAADTLARIVEARDRSRDLVRSFTPDVLHFANLAVSSFHAAEILRIAPIPSLLTVHQFWPADRLRAGSSVRRAVSMVDAVVCVSARLKSFVESRIPEVRERIEFIPNFIVPRDRRPAPLPWSPPRLLCVARLDKRKNLGLALTALARIRRESPETRLMIAGDGIERHALEAQARRLGVRDQVDFLGWVAQERVRELISEATMVLMPSETEGLPLAALEAAEGARPVLATRVGGVPEVVLDGVTGRLVEPGDEEAFVDALRGLMENRPLAEEMGEAARRHVRKTFSRERSLQAYAKLYRDLTVKERVRETS